MHITIQEKIKQAKIEYLKRDRIPEGIVSRKISISWYKCKLAGIKMDSSIMKTEQTPLPYDETWLLKMKEILPAVVTYFITDLNGVVIFSNIVDENFDTINHLGEMFVGTTSLGLSLASKREEQVNANEHFLSIFEQFYSKTMPLEEMGFYLTVFYKNIDNGALHSKIKMDVDYLLKRKETPPSTYTHSYRRNPTPVIPSTPTTLAATSPTVSHPSSSLSPSSSSSSFSFSPNSSSETPSRPFPPSGKDLHHSLAESAKPAQRIFPFSVEEYDFKEVLEIDELENTMLSNKIEKNWKILFLSGSVADLVLYQLEQQASISRSIRLSLLTPENISHFLSESVTKKQDLFLYEIEYLSDECCDQLMEMMELKIRNIRQIKEPRLFLSTVYSKEEFEMLTEKQQEIVEKMKDFLVELPYRSKLHTGAVEEKKRREVLSSRYSSDKTEERFHEWKAELPNIKKLADLNMHILEEELRKEKGDIKKVQETLGLSRATIYRKISKLKKMGRYP